VLLEKLDKLDQNSTEYQQISNQFIQAYRNYDDKLSQFKSSCDLDAGKSKNNSKANKAKVLQRRSSTNMTTMNNHTTTNTMATTINTILTKIIATTITTLETATTIITKTTTATATAIDTINNNINKTTQSLPQQW
jgi:hypothetical protein